MSEDIDKMFTKRYAQQTVHQKISSAPKNLPGRKVQMSNWYDSHSLDIYAAQLEDFK